MIKLISHRGNLEGPFPDMENNPDYIDVAISKCGLVEIDLRVINGLYRLGHDYPQYGITLGWLLNRSKNVIVHCKDIAALARMMEEKMMCFYHQSDSHTPIYNSNMIWSHSVKEACDKSIIPLMTKEQIDEWSKTNVYGICSDDISYLKQSFNYY